MSAKHAPPERRHLASHLAFNPTCFMAYHQFRDTNGQPYGGLETLYVDQPYLLANEWIRPDDASPTGYVGGAPYSGPGNGDPYEWYADPTDLIGWYWQAGLPGCMPDGDPSGPFLTESEALDDAGALRTFDLPAHWAPALINGDPTGLDDRDCAMLDAVEHGESLGHCYGIVGDDSDNGPEAEFRHWHDAKGYGVLPCDCYRYIFEWPTNGENA